MAPGITDYINPFLNMANGVGSIATANTEEQKTQATGQFIQIAINSVFSIVNKVMEAQQETQQNAAEASDLDSDAQEIRTRTYARAQDTISTIEANATRVESLLQNLQASAEQLAEYQKQLEDQKNIIETNKAILNNPEASRDERKAALEGIKNAGTAITELETVIQSYSEQAEVVGAEIEEATVENEELTSLSEQITAEGQAEIQQVTQQAAGEATQTVTDTATQGTKDIATGTAEIAAGTPMLASPFTALEGQNLINQGTQNTEAGGIRTAESAITLGSVVKTTKDGYSIASQIISFGSTMATGNNNTFNLLGALSTNYYEDHIRTIGSWSNIEGVGAEFAQAADEELGKLNGSNEESEGTAQDQNSGNGSTSAGDRFDTKKLELEEERA